MIIKKIHKKRFFFDMFSANLGFIHAVDKVIFSKKTKYQKVDILDTKSCGRCLVLDGILQSAACDEFIYHEALIHPALLSHPHPKRVYIAGGGEGAPLREVLKHRLVEEVRMVDIDKELVNACKKYLFPWHRGAFKDSRVIIKHGDARADLENVKNTYDIIYTDLSEPVEGGPSYLLYTQEFYSLIFNRLTKNGILVVYAGTLPFFLSNSYLPAIVKTLKEVFPMVMPYHATVPSFGGNCEFVLASKRIDPKTLSIKTIKHRVNQYISKKLNYYNEKIHHSQFSLPAYLESRIQNKTSIIQDKKPVFLKSSN